MSNLIINTALIDRLDLSIQEKMCCIVLARLAMEEKDKPWQIEELAEKMGCTKKEAVKALDKIKKKGLLMQIPEIQLSELESRKPRVIKKPKKAQKPVFEDFETVPAQKQKPRENMQKKIEELQGIVLEPVTENTFRILLNMAGGNVEHIKRRYKELTAQQTHEDVLEALMEELQGGKPPVETEKTSEIETSQETKQVITQINQKRIAELYQKSKKTQ